MPRQVYTASTDRAFDRVCEGEIIESSKTYLSCLVVILLLGVSLFGLQSVYGLGIDSVVPSNDVIIWEVSGEPESLDPHVNFERFGNWIFYNVYETLYTYPFGSTDSEPIQPLLAEFSPIVSSDGLEYTIGLRQDVTFHDETPFNASCVKWNIERGMKIFADWGPMWMIAEPLKGGRELENIAYSEGSGSIAFQNAFNDWISSSGAINVLDEYTIQFVLEEPYSPFIAALSSSAGSIMSPSYALSHASDSSLKVWGNYGVHFGDTDNYMAEQMCGTGPYKLVDWSRYNYIELGLNSNYWRDSTEPMAGSIINVIIQTNEDRFSRLGNLQTGETDGCDWPKVDAYITLNDIFSTSTNPDLFVSTGGFSFSLVFAGFNLGTIRINEIEYPNPFSNLHFRRAISYGSVPEAFIQEELAGFGIRPLGPIPIGMYGHNGTAFDLSSEYTKAVDEWNQAMSNSTFVDVLNLLGNTIELNYVITSSYPSRFYTSMAESLTNIWNSPLTNQTGLDQPMKCALGGLLFSDYINAS
ncbi:MAG: ABC transporter substrate-binding protein, partial [Candidatus Thorarchaeota archaeon]